MRLKITFHAGKPLTLPVNYQEMVQAFIYGAVSPTLAKILHDYGFPHGKRNFKLFTFSRLMGRYRVDREAGTITFSSPVVLHFASPVHQFVEEFGNMLLLRERHRLGGSEVTVTEVGVESNRVEERKVDVRMLSPLTMYSTLQRPDGRKKTYYYSPFEQEFSELIGSNLIKKYAAFFGSEPREKGFSITPLRVSKKDRILTRYKGFVIQAWGGTYRLEGVPELLTLALDAGLGGKNSQGFGCGVKEEDGKCVKSII